MGLLDRALNFAQRAYNYVVGNDNVSDSANKSVKKTDASVTNKQKNVINPQKSKPVNSVHNPSGTIVGKVGDIVEKQKVSTKPADKQKEASSITHKNTDNKKFVTKHGSKDAVIQNKIANITAKIEQKCQKFGIKYSEAKATILHQMRFSYDEFMNLSPVEQLSLLYSIDGALNLYIIDKGKRKISPEADKASVIGQTAKNIEKVKEEGGIESVEDFDKGVGSISQELEGKVTEKTTDDEYIELLEESKREFKKSIELERIAEIKKCNGDKQKIAEVNSKYEARLNAFEAQRQIEFAASVGPERARLSIYLRDGKNFANAHEVALGVYSGYNKTIVADSFNHDFEVEAKRRYFENGDSISSEEFAKAITYTTQFMSYEALNKFQSDAHNFRAKVENGEIDAPYMTKDDFKAVSIAIATGIVNNNSVSADDKSHLISKWNNLASQFSDYNDVLNTIQPVINGMDNNKTASAMILQSYINPQIMNNHSAVKVIEKIGDKKATANELEQALSVMSYEQAKQQFTKNSDRDFVEVVLHNPKLKGHKHHIVSYLKTLSAEDLNNITKGCSTDMFLFVLRNITPDKAGRLYDLSKDEKCYDVKKLGEEIVEEGRDNAAA